MASRYSRSFKMNLLLFTLIWLLFGINLIAFNSLRASEPEQAIWIQGWHYFESNTFKHISTGLFFPIILVFVERVFKIGDAVEERIQRERQAKIEKRQECIEKTSKMWNDLYSLTSEVRHFDMDTRKEKEIIDLLLKLSEFSSTSNDVVNMWHFRFPELKKHQGTLLYYTNLLLGCASNVAQYIQMSYTPRSFLNTNEISRIQEYLEVIQMGVKGIFYHRIFIILKRSDELRNPKVSEKDKEIIKAEIDFKINELNKKSNEITKEMLESYTPFFFLSGNKNVNDFQELFKEITPELFFTYSSDTQRTIMVKNLDEFKKLLNEILENKEFFRDSLYSTTFMKRLAIQMCSKDMMDNLNVFAEFKQKMDALQIKKNDG